MISIPFLPGSYNDAGGTPALPARSPGGDIAIFMDLDMPDTLKPLILSIIAESPARLSTPRLVSILAREGITRRAVREAIAELVAENRLTYTSHFGGSYLEPSFSRPVKVGGRVVLAPPRVSMDLHGDEVGVRIAPGAAFGTGAHPTTRLALVGLEWAVAAAEGTIAHWRALDIGTGSGVLALAAVQLGAAMAVGIDLDPCARAEARENVRGNGLEGRVTVEDRDLGELDGPFELILANLRTPTLARLGPEIARRLAPDGRVVLTGARPDEMADLLAGYARIGLIDRWRETDGGWAGAVVSPADGAVPEPIGAGPAGKTPAAGT